jgi:hypothetical protein
VTVLDESSSIEEVAATVSHVDLTRIQRGSAAEGQHMPYLEFRVALKRSPA